jgi:hypothetical protein
MGMTRFSSKWILSHSTCGTFASAGGPRTSPTVISAGAGKTFLFGRHC